MSPDPDPAKRLAAVFEAHHRRVYAYAVTRAGRQFADDVVSSTFLVAWQKIESLPAEPLPWLLAIARNVARRRYEQESRQVALAAEMREWVEADVADGVTERSVVLGALARLSEDDREVLTLIAWHGLTNAEAAKVIGVSTATFFVRLHRARKRLTALSSSQPESRLEQYQ